MKLFFLAIPAFLLISCQSSPESIDDAKHLSNPIKSEYTLIGSYSDYQYFKGSLPQLVQRSFERSKRWALLKEGPSALSYVSSDIIEGPRFDGAVGTSPDPTHVDWMPWWVDVLKIEVSARILDKNPDIESFAPKSCLKIYQARLEESLITAEGTPLVSANPSLRVEGLMSFDSVWQNASDVKIKNEKIIPWLERFQIRFEKALQIREFYFSRDGTKRRMILVKRGVDKILSAVEIVRDPYLSSKLYSKSAQPQVCERVNLALSLAQSPNLSCADLEGSDYLRIDDKLFPALLSQVNNPSDVNIRELYISRCQQLADYQSAQWTDQDKRQLTNWLKLYPQIEKRLVYFATMESKILLAEAAKNRQ